MMASSVSYTRPPWCQERLHRWTMWRININQELIHGIEGQHVRPSAHSYHAYTDNHSLTQRYIHNPGVERDQTLSMRNAYGRPASPGYPMGDTLYFLYGLPRVTASSRLPGLYSSLPNLATTELPNDGDKSSNIPYDRHQALSNLAMSNTPYSSDHALSNLSMPNTSYTRDQALSNPAMPNTSYTRDHALSNLSMPNISYTRDQALSNLAMSNTSYTRDQALSIPPSDRYQGFYSRQPTRTATPVVNVRGSDNFTRQSAPESLSSMSSIDTIHYKDTPRDTHGALQHDDPLDDTLYDSTYIDIHDDSRHRPSKGSQIDQKKVRDDHNHPSKLPLYPSSPVNFRDSPEAGGFDKDADVEDRSNINKPMLVPPSVFHSEVLRRSSSTHTPDRGGRPRGVHPGGVKEPRGVGLNKPPKHYRWTEPDQQRLAGDRRVYVDESHLKTHL